MVGNMKKKVLKNLITEDELINKFGFSEPQLKNLRTQSGFPYVPVCQNVRMYFEESVLHWCAINEKGMKFGINVMHGSDLKIRT